MGRSPLGISAVSTAGKDWYEYPPLLCLECRGRMGSEPGIGTCMTRGVSGRRLPKGWYGLHPLPAAGRPSVGATCGMFSWAGAGVARCVMGLYEPSGVMHRRSWALSDDDGETGQVRPPEVGWLPCRGGASGS